MFDSAQDVLLTIFWKALINRKDHPFWRQKGTSLGSAV